MTRAGRNRQAGLTLIEMLIVLVIVGIASAATMLGVQSLARDTAAQDEAVRLAAHLTLAVDEALISRVPMELVWTAQGYGFQRWSDGEWRPAANPRLAEHILPASVTLARTDGQDAAVTIAADGLGPAVALRLYTDRSIWQVAFDGLTFAAGPAL